MNLNRNLYIPTVFAISLLLVALTACSDEPIFDRNDTQFETDLVLFDAFVGTPAPATRSAEDPADLPPVTLDGGGVPSVSSPICLRQ